MVGTLSSMQKDLTRGRSGCSTQWMQYAVDAVCSECSRIVVYGGGDIVFDTERSNQRMQWTQYAVRSTQ